MKIATPNSLWHNAFDRFLENRMALVCAIFFFMMTAVCFFGPLASPYTYQQQALAEVSMGPSATHWLGTDTLGRDVCTRILYGGRVSLGVGFAATAVAMLIGVTYGMIAGYAGGALDSLMMRSIDVLYALPFTVFVIILTVVFGRNIVLLFVAIGAVEWLTMARMVRGQVLALKSQEFVQAAQLLGLSRRRILFKHLLPNLMGPVIVYATLIVPSVMLLEATLSFLGLGVQPPMSSWGSLIRDGAEVMEVFPWMLLGPAVFFCATLFALNFIGDGLRDALDPQGGKR